MMDKRQQCLILLAMLTDLCGGNIVHCQSECFAEVGVPFVLPCGIRGSNYDLYWYKGNDTTTVPILSRENGQLSGTEYGKGDLELTTDGSIRIINTEIRHEGSYTLLAFSETFERYTVTTLLTVYVRSDSRCVEVDSCPSTCSDCYLNVTGSGDLTCHVRGARPSIGLDWIVTNQSGISFVKDQQEIRHDEESGTYSTTRMIHYTVDHCGGTATIYCNATHHSSILDVNKYSIQISSETCNETTPDTTNLPRKESISVVWPVVISVIVFLVIVLVACVILRKKGRELSNEVTEFEEYMELKPSGSDSKRQPLRQDSKPKDVKKELIKALIKHYEQFCFIKPLPWGEPIPIDALYTACECTVTTDNETSHCTSEYLSTAKFSLDCRRVFITADLGYGKTTFTQHLVKRWISQEMTVKENEKFKGNRAVLIYLHLKEVTRSVILSEFVQRMLPAGNNMTCSDIDGILRSNECHILLDGLDSLSMSSQAEATSEVSENDTLELTIGNLLDDRININIYKHLRVWVTSREADDMKCEFSLPYSKVKMLEFSRDQIVQFIRKTCKYYYEQRQIPEMALFVDDANDNISSDNATTYKTDYQLSKTTEGTNKPSSCKQIKSEEICATQSDSDVVYVSESKENINEMHVVNENTEEIKEPTVHTKLLEDAQQDSNKLPPDGESNESKRKKDELSTEKKNEAAAATGTMETGKRNALNIKVLQKFFEVQKIFSIFSKTPLLQIMIIHVITCRILDPTGRYKEMNINKLTTVIRLVINCLESRYVQKVQKDSIKADIKTLESKLGEIAFQSKLKVTLRQKDFWESELGKEENVKTALEIGLLKYSKGVTSGGLQLAELAFSSHSGIEFYHEFFKEYFAAQYISENKVKWKWLDEFIKGCGDEATARLLQFTFGMNIPELERVFKTLADERKMWNTLIDCIYEVGDPGRKKSMLVDLKNTAKRGGFNMNLNINYLERKYHSVAVSDFFKACNEHQISIPRMTFREPCAIDFLKKVTLPSLEVLYIVDMKVNTIQFVSVLTNLIIRKCPENLLFVACEVPQSLTGEDLSSVALAMKENEKMKIYNLKTTSQTNMMILVFNCQKGKWDKTFFPKNI